MRDGDSHMSDLLIHNQGGSRPRPVTTSHNTMLIEFMAPYDRRAMADFQQVGEGFVAVYTAVSKWLLSAYDEASSLITKSFRTFVS